MNYMRSKHNKPAEMQEITLSMVNSVWVIPLKKSPLKSEGGDTNGVSSFTIDFITISRAFLPYCGRVWVSHCPKNHKTSSQRSAWCSYFVVKIESAQIPSFCCSSVTMSESTLLQRMNTNEVHIWREKSLQDLREIRNKHPHQAF